MHMVSTLSGVIKYCHSLNCGLMYQIWQAVGPITEIQVMIEKEQALEMTQAPELATLKPPI